VVDPCRWGVDFGAVECVEHLYPTRTTLSVIP